MFDVVYHKSCPKELVKIVNPLFKQFSAIVPKWVEDIYVVFDDNQDENFTVAETTTGIDYRKVCISFYPDYLYEATDKIYIFVHELCHSIYGAVFQQAVDSINNILVDSGATALQLQVIESLRKCNEGSTQDLTNMIFKLMNLDKRTGKRKNGKK